MKYFTDNTAILDAEWNQAITTNNQELAKIKQIEDGYKSFGEAKIAIKQGRTFTNCY